MALFFGVGAGFDWLFDTTPVFMIVFTVLGAIGLFAKWKYRYDDRMNEHEATRAARASDRSRGSMSDRGGKSTLVHDVIYAALKRAKGDWDRRIGSHRKLEGAEFVDDVVLVDQAPIGRTPRSNPVTYLKAFDPIRELFAATKDARTRGLTASDFSFNVPGGRCEACEGEGVVKVEMQFLADVFVPCDQCEGKRFKPQVLDVRYRGRSVDQVLDMTVREALTFFSSSPKVLRRLQVLDEIGLGYLRLGSRRRRSRAARRSASRSRRTCRHIPAIASSTSSTSRRPAFTSTTSPSCSRRARS